MAEQNYKVLITASGFGQRLGDITRYTNKALVRVGKKPALAYIIESYPKNVPIVITIGHFADQVRNFVRLAYPDRDFEFVEVDKYEGSGTSLGYSMLCAKNSLQCPFIFHACDTLVKDAILPPDKNWMAGFKGGDSSRYTSWKVIKPQTLILNDPGAVDFDFIHIGLVGIKDYKEFWSALEDLYKENPDNPALSDCRTIERMLKRNIHFNLIDFPSWLDIGNVAALNYARENINDYFENLDKVDESIFIFDDFVIKFFFNKEVIRNRIKRAEVLDGLVPKIEGVVENFYRYRYVVGDLYARVANPTDFSLFLNWAKNNLWKRKEAVSREEFKKACRKFYCDKTKQRIDKFLKDNSIEDGEKIINGEKVPSIKDILEMVDFDRLSECKQYVIHGDFILDNIIKTADGHCLLDWRQDFGGLIEVGDIYYDLAKLNHNLTVNHDIINSNLFTIDIGEKAVECDIMQKNNLVECQNVLHNFVQKEGFDLQKVKLLTGLIWLNMSPLHHHPFSLFLYYFGKLNLWKAIKEI